jgi:hypothetical protein
MYSLIVLELADLLERPVGERFGSRVLGLFASGQQTVDGLAVDHGQQLLTETGDQVADEAARGRQHRVVDVGVLGQDLQEGENVAQMRRHGAQVDFYR